MKWFEYGDEKISYREILIAIPSMVIGAGVLSMPQGIAVTSIGSDGWVVLLVGGLMMTFLAWLASILAARYSGQTFLGYSTRIVSKPVAVVFTFVFAISFLFMAAYEIREISEISEEYLFNRTPVEAIALAFLLVVVYAVSGSRAGLFRLNMMFFPIILLIVIILLTFNLNKFSFGNLMPVFQTGMTGYWKGLVSSLISFMGFGIVFFYIHMADKPEKTPRMTIYGMLLTLGVYVMLFIASIGILGNTITRNLLFPTIELAKEADIPGGFFERFESIFFTIWIMAIFNTATMALDIVVYTLGLIFKKAAKIHFIFIITPIVFFIAMYPKDTLDMSRMGTYISYFSITYTVMVMVILGVVAKIRKVKPK